MVRKPGEGFKASQHKFPLLVDFVTSVSCLDKTVETFQYNFQFRAMVPSCPKETNSPPSPPLVQCCLGLAAQACISCVAANNIEIDEGGNGLLICDSKHFCQGECKKNRYSCNVSQQVLSEVAALHSQRVWTGRV